jgi:hypothetical protein
MLQCGGWSMADVTFHPKDAEGKATPVFSSDVAVMLGTLQELGFSIRTDTDASISVKDGRKGDLTFKGFTVTPQYSLIAGGVDRHVQLVHRAAILDSLKMAIYQWLGDDWAETKLLIKADSWAGRFKEATQFLVEVGQQYWERTLTPADLELTAQQHKTNQAALKLWYELLDNSMDSTHSEGLALLAGNAENAEMLHRGVGLTILAYLTASSDGFWNVLSQLCSAFQLLYVPDKALGMGKLIMLKDVMANPEPLEVPITGCTFINGSTGIVPLQQVLIRAKGSSEFAVTGETEDPQVISAWPEEPENTSGQVLTTSLPAWIVPVESISSTPQTVVMPVAEPGMYDPVNIGHYNQKTSQILKRTRRAMQDCVDKLLSEYARNLYCDRCLGGTSFQATIPLDLRAVPGRRYTVTSGKKKLFEGFLAAVSHGLEIAAGGGQGQAMSRLQFTHVELGEFELPHK